MCLYMPVSSLFEAKGRENNGTKITVMHGYTVYPIHCGSGMEIPFSFIYREISSMVSILLAPLSSMNAGTWLHVQDVHP